MKNSILALAAATVALGVGACGGEGLGGSSADGIWNGAFQSVPAVNGALDMDLTVTSGTITGTARVIVGGVIHMGTVTGTATGAAVIMSANYGGYGTVAYDGLIVGGIMNGSYNRNSGAEQGTFQVTHIANVTKNIQGSWNGNYTYTGSPSNGTFAIAFTQTGNLIAGTLTVDGTMNGSISGEIFGDNVRFTSNVAGWGTGNYTAVVSGTPPNSVSGTFAIGGNTGAFSVAP